MEKKVENILQNLEEKVNFFREIGAEFIFFRKESPFASLEQKIIHCTLCSLSQTRKKAVPGEGSLKTELIFVGEAPGYEEDVQGKPFVGKAGQLLTKIIKAMNLNRQDVYITNVLKCRPPNNRTPHRDEIESCKSYLLEQVKMIKPKVIVALGKVAADFFIQSDLGMASLRGNFYEFEKIQVMPTFHPSYLVRNEGDKKIRKMVWEDMQKVMAVLEKK